MLPGGVEGEPGGHLAKEEWFLRRQKFNTSVANAKKTFDRLCSCVNREVVYNLYTYVWDLVGVLHMLASYIDWLTLGKFSPNYKQLVIGRHTWFSGKFKVAGQFSTFKRKSALAHGFSLDQIAFLRRALPA